LLVSVSKTTIPRYGLAGSAVDVQIPGLMPCVVAVTVMRVTVQLTSQNPTKFSKGWCLFQKSFAQHKVNLGVLN